MATDTEADPLSLAERGRLAALRATESLAALVGLTGADDEHGAYFAAKRDWRRLRGKELAARPPEDGLPGAEIVVEGVPFHVHGVTHAGTDAERSFLREHVARFLDAGATVYCEQGIRQLYFGDFDPVCEMDDYTWAMHRCRELGSSFHVDGVPGTGVDALVEDVSSLASEFRATAFSLIERNADVYGERFAAALGDVASAFLQSHENLGTGTDYASFAASRRAARDPTRLGELQRYYERSFLPQPVEREWLRRHDPELEVVTHARNERMADYAVYHADDDGPVHLVVGAAHQPGIRYYLEQHRDGERALDGFEPV